MKCISIFQILLNVYFLNPVRPAAVSAENGNHSIPSMPWKSTQRLYAVIWSERKV